MAEPGSQLSIVEVGGGTGTLARDVLDHVRSAAPQSYAECSYTSVEISPQLAQVQQHTVADMAGHASHYKVLDCRKIREDVKLLSGKMQTSEPAFKWRSKLKTCSRMECSWTVNVSLPLQDPLTYSSSCLQVECRDAGDLAGWDIHTDLTFILMMEVLDNCPHDRVHRNQDTGEWQQTHVLEETSQVRLAPWSLSEILKRRRGVCFLQKVPAHCADIGWATCPQRSR